jgi:hypothetical protein
MTPAPPVKSIAWKEVFPWLIILRTLPLAASFSVWTLALVGVVLVPIGWLAIETVFVNRSVRQENEILRDPQFNEFVLERRSPYRGYFEATRDAPEFVQLWGVRFSGPQLAFQKFVEPVRRLFDPQMNFRKFSYLLLGTIWTIFVWSVIGCGITRICLLRLTRDESAGLDQAFEFLFGGKMATAVVALLLPLMGLALLCIPPALVGLLLTTDLGAIVGGLLWFIVLGCSGLAALLLFAWMFGWPLIICSISAENQNSLDAITRASAYVLQRPLNYAFYALVCLLFGGLCWAVVSQVATSTIQLGYWSASWGANVASGERIEQLSADNLVNNQAIVPGPVTLMGDPAPMESQPANESGTLSIARSLIRFWNGMVSTLAVAFLFGQFWSLASAVYLLLRRDVDETEMDEVFLSERTRSFDLPPLQADDRGIPVIRPLDASPGPSDGE